MGENELNSVPANDTVWQMNSYKLRGNLSTWE